MDIKALRNRAGITQKKLGDMCGLSQTAIANYEAGIRNISLGNAMKIVSALRKRGIKVSMQDLEEVSRANK